MLAALLLASPAAMSGEQSLDRVALVTQVGAETDADNFDSWKIRGGALFDYASNWRYAGVVAQNTHYSTDGWSVDAPAVLGLYRNQKRDTLEGVRAEGGVVSVSGHTRFIGDATWSHRPVESTGIELILAGDLVGTRQALEEGIAYTLAAASVEQQFGKHFTAIALAGWQPFTDGNSRALVRARMIWSLLPEQGLSVQARWRQYSSSDSDVGGAYFNPDHYRNWDAGLSLRRHLGGWTVSGLAGGGQERINDNSWQSTGIAEVRVEGPVSRAMRLEASAIYSNAAGFATTPNYWYGSINVNLIVPLGH